MSELASITINDTATPFIAKLMDLLDSNAMAKLCENPLLDLVRDKMLQNEEEHPNKKGFPRSHFYKQSFDLTHSQVNGSMVSIAISKEGFNQRFFGGPITPVTKKYLTIPACAEAYNHTARDFQGLLKLLWATKDGAPTPIALTTSPVAPVWYGTKKGKRIVKHGRTLAGKIYYWLSKGVNQQGDKSLMVTDQQIIERIDETVKNELASIEIGSGI